MRIIYFFLKLTLPYSLMLYFSRRKLVNGYKERKGRTIYVSNHASSFMDPLVIGIAFKPILFFMTRSDIFTAFTKPILWAAHMLPIFREHDGEDVQKKNKAVFNRCNKVLYRGKNLLIFGEGFTDDVFIRRLKPIKKGAVRIGFDALKACNWEKKIYIAAVGCNYSDPTQMRSDILISCSEKICLNDFRQEYEQNPSKIISEITQQIEFLIRQQITHIEDKNLSEFHENIQKITRKGMNVRCFDPEIPLEERWRYSQYIANILNEQPIESSPQLLTLKNDLSSYFDRLQTNNLKEHLLYEYQISNGSRKKERLFLLFLFPFAVLGFIHCGLFYLLCKRFVEKTFKRPVFWSSVKMIAGTILMGIGNIPVIFLFYSCVYPSYWLAFLYYLCIGWLGLAAYLWVKTWKTYKEKRRMKQLDLSAFWETRKVLLERTLRVFPF